MDQTRHLGAADVRECVQVVAAGLTGAHHGDPDRAFQGAGGEAQQSVGPPHTQRRRRDLPDSSHFVGAPYEKPNRVSVSRSSGSDTGAEVAKLCCAATIPSTAWHASAKLAMEGPSTSDERVRSSKA